MAVFNHPPELYKVIENENYLCRTGGIFYIPPSVLVVRFLMRPPRIYSPVFAKLCKKKHDGKAYPSCST